MIFKCDEIWTPLLRYSNQAAEEISDSNIRERCGSYAMAKMRQPLGGACAGSPNHSGNASRSREMQSAMLAILCDLVIHAVAPLGGRAILLKCFGKTGIGPRCAGRKASLQAATRNVGANPTA
jgi:hypothetical protein